jgi:hypothetical protein
MQSGKCPRLRKEEVEPEPTYPDTIDVVYPLSKESTWQDNEIRYSLRSLEKNLVGLGRVFIVGRKPKWMTNVIHIPSDDPHPRNKDANIIDKVLLACHGGISDRFLFMSDDQLILSPTKAVDLKAYHIGCLRKKDKGFWGGGRWKRGLRRTYDLLLSKKKTVNHYDSHVPQPMDRKTFVEIMSAIDYRTGDGYTINTLYFNQAATHHYRLNGSKATIERSIVDVDEVRKQLMGKTYLGYNNSGLTNALKTVLAETFPEPSRYENG